jgi:hypothetical protein
MRQSGVVADAEMTIGGVKTRYRVPFSLVNDVGCVAQVPDCPGAAGIDDQVANGFYGIMGVGLARSQTGLGNPLLALPRRYSHSWSIALSGSAGRLTLGDRAPAHAVAQFLLPPDGRDLSGARAWKDDLAKVCWGAVGLRGSGCEPTVFDTGSVTMFWYGGLLSHTTTYPGSVFVTPGTYIAAWAHGAPRPFWTFTAGTHFSQNTLIAFRGGKPEVIAAVQAFLKFKVTYDDTHGEILLSRS